MAGFLKNRGGGFLFKSSEPRLVCSKRQDLALPASGSTRPATDLNSGLVLCIYNQSTDAHFSTATITVHSDMSEGCFNVGYCALARNLILKAVFQLAW